MRHPQLSFRDAFAPAFFLLVTACGAALAVVSAQNLNVDDSDALGLISALPTGYLVGVALVLASFIAVLRRETLIRPILTIQLLTIIVLLYGLTSYTEDIARLPTTWVHAGFIEYIQRKGEVLVGYDARMVWPGFFAGGAMLNLLGGTTNQSAVLEYAPLVFNLGFAIPIWLVARSTGAPARTCWLATLLFFLLNWVGQDYYSPQGMNYLIALSFMAVMLRVFFTDNGLVPVWANQTVAPVFRRRLPRLTARLERFRLAPSDTPAMQISGRQKAGVVGALVILYAASVVSHQLTPFFLIILTLGLVLLDRVNLRTIPIVMIVGVFVWISFAATPFWQGQLGNLFGDVGKVGGVVDQGVSNRVAGDPNHIPVIYTRLLLTGTVWLAAAFGFIRRLRRGRVDVLCLVGFIAPFSVLGGQAYGGEAVLRVYLFALPFAVTLAASAIAPDAKKWGMRTTAIVSVIIIGLLPVFFLTRYGNESFEHFDQEELTAAHRLYEMAPPGSTFVALNSDIPWRSEHIEQYRFRALGDDVLPPDDVAAVSGALVSENGERTFLLATQSQQNFAQMMQGQAPGWTQSIIDRLMATGKYTIVYQNSRAQILTPKDQL